MKPRLLSFFVIALALAMFSLPQTSHAQSISLFPAQVPNGIAANSGEQYHQRFDMLLTGSPTGQSVALTITLPPELSLVTGSVTAAGDGTSAQARMFIHPTGTTSTTIRMGLSGCALTGRTLSIEFDVTTPTSFTGIPNGTKKDTSYTFNFAAGANLTDRDVAVAKHQNLRLSALAFSAPGSTGDTTAAGGRFYKMDFPSALPDPSHRAVSGLTAGPQLTDTGTDVLYTFYLSTDSTLVTRPGDANPVGFYTMRSDGSSSSDPLLGTRQNPTFIPNTYIREDFVTNYDATALDSLAGVISLSGTQSGLTYYVYVLADPAPGRFPNVHLGTNGSSKKGYNPSTLGAFSGGTFLGRSGPLLVQHPPEFVITGWDYDTDTADKFDNTGVVQVPSDVLYMADVDANEKDNRDITVDSGSFFPQGAAFAGFNSGNIPSSISTIDLLWKLADSDNPGNVAMNIFVSTQSGLTVASFANPSPDISDLTGAIQVPGTDTLTTAHQKFRFDPIVRDATTNLVTSYVPAGEYFVYFAASDGTGRTLSQVFNDPFISSPTAAKLTVKHTPNLTPDTFSLNDFDGTSDGDLDVITGIGMTQMQADGDGKDLTLSPAQRYVTVSWGEQGLNGDIDVDDNATIEFYYSTRSNFRDIRGSAAYTTGNSDGSDILSAITQGNNDTHFIGSASEDADGQFDNQFVWDLWSYASPEGTIPVTGIRYYLYALLKSGSQDRLVSLTSSDPTPGATGAVSMALSFDHPPYIRPTEPSRDMTVTVDEPVLISWEAVDVDNAQQQIGTSLPANSRGRVSPNDRSNSPNIRILLTTADFGEVTNWASLTAAGQGSPLWVGNSNNGALGGEIELNEGVDTSFVIVGNRMRSNIAQGTAFTGAPAAQDLQTNGGVGKTYFVYLAIDGGTDGTVADAVTGAGPQLTAFSGHSPIVRAPGKITFTGTVPANPPTSSRFIVAKRMETTVDEVIRYGITPDVSVSGTQINVVDIFMTVDADKFEAIDQQPGVAGIQPFTLGSNSAISSANVSQGAYIIGNQLHLDFIYSDVTSGLTFFDGLETLAFANLRAKPLSGSTVSTTISVDNSGTRISKMLNSTNSDINVAVPQPTQVTINRRTTVSGKVPLQGRTSSADTVTFFLRPVGSYATVADSLFNLNDVDPAKYGVQVETTDIDGKFSLTNVPSGRFVLTASVQRHLTGSDTISVQPGLDLSSVQPTRDGSGVQQSYLRAGDAAGYQDSTGNSVPDGVVDSADLNAINDALFSQPGDSNYNTYADMNRDNVINGSDKDYATANITSNTGASGSIRPVFPVFKQAQPNGDNGKALVTLTGLPESEIRPGETFDVSVMVSGASAVRTYEVHLSFDPTKLAVEDLVSEGSLLQNYLTNMSGKMEQGDLGLVNSILGQTPVGASGEGTLATVRFRAISRASETKLALGDAMLIDVQHTGFAPQVDGEGTIVLSNDPMVYHDADGAEIKGLILATADAKVDFNDFLVLARSFGTDASSPNFDLRADLNADNQVSFADFVIFSKDFGREAVDAPASARASKPATEGGANSAAAASLNLKGAARMGEPVTLTVDLSDAKAVQGWGLTVQYDADLFEFVSAQAPEAGLLTAAGTDAPLFLVHQEKAGEVTLAHALNAGQAAAGEGSIAVLTFQPKGDFEDSRFDVFNGIVFDANDLPNQVLAGDALQVRMAPAQFALGQNYPNPFNPETTISYDLADASRVKLEIYNVMGQLVNTLVSEEQAAGRYRVVWNGSDAHQRQVASGVYFYRIQTEAFKAVRKLMLLK